MKLKSDFWAYKNGLQKIVTSDQGLVDTFKNDFLQAWILKFEILYNVTISV